MLLPGIIAGLNSYWQRMVRDFLPLVKWDVHPSIQKCCPQCPKYLLRRCLDPKVFGAVGNMKKSENRHFVLRGKRNSGWHGWAQRRSGGCSSSRHQSLWPESYNLESQVPQNCISKLLTRQYLTMYLCCCGTGETFSKPKRRFKRWNKVWSVQTKLRFGCQQSRTKKKHKDSETKSLRKNG